jgi:hypothetical protein
LSQADLGGHDIEQAAARVSDLPFARANALVDSGEEAGEWASNTEGVPTGMPNLLDPPQDNEATPQSNAPLSNGPGPISKRWAEERATLQVQLNDAHMRAWMMGVAGLLIGTAVTAAWFA